MSKFVNRHKYNHRHKSLLHSWGDTTAVNACTIRAGIELGSVCRLRRVENSSRLQLYANQASLATRFHSGAYISYTGNVICGGTQFLSSAVASNAKCKLDKIAAGHITQIGTDSSDYSIFPYNAIIPCMNRCLITSYSLTLKTLNFNGKSRLGSLNNYYLFPMFWRENRLTRMSSQSCTLSSTCHRCSSETSFWGWRRWTRWHTESRSWYHCSVPLQHSVPSLVSGGSPQDFETRCGVEGQGGGSVRQN